MSKSVLNYSQDPSHENHQLTVRKEAPYNAEPLLPDLVQHYITPEKYFFCRNHGPMPTLDEKHTVDIFHDTLHTFTLQQLKQDFEKVSVMMVMECAGNRRDGLHKVKFTKGVIWGPGAVGNTVYSGCRLKDVLESVGVTSKIKNFSQMHAAFESVEQCEEEKCYGSSIPLSKALDEFGDVLLAYEINGQPLTRDRGYPIRVVVPGYIGARSVKFLKSIVIQDQESSSFFQQRDYKILPETIVTEEQANAYWCKLPAIGEYNVQSYVCVPSDGLHSGPCLKQNVQGYALSGGGRAIQRVDVSGDDGKTWKTALLHQPESQNVRVWSWCLWVATIETKRNVRILSRAVDSAGNIQPEFPIWNYRGVMNNSWRTIDSEQANI
ncbi:molybdopterin binding oxidoreductase [Sporodiniella umbellata]|nr:molybdopterin binding oxidoreductase [Sporodiniella umbellata]